jgi:hypothetical protein
MILYNCKVEKLFQRLVEIVENHLGKDKKAGGEVSPLPVSKVNP